MKTTLLLLAAMIVLLMANYAVASEYYVIKSRSGILRVVDHEPQGGATIVKGPFKTMEEAERAVGQPVSPPQSEDKREP